MEGHKVPPSFPPAISTINPEIESLLKQDQLYIQKGVNYSRYVTIFPFDSQELIKSSKNVNFIFKDSVSFVNSRRIFLELKYHFQKGDGTAITRDDEVSCPNVVAHSLIDSLTINLGSCDLFRDNGFYALLARYNFLTNYTKAARKTFLQTFEGAFDDIGEQQKTNIAECYDTAADNTKTPNNTQGHIAESMLNKKEHTSIIKLYSPLERISSYIPANVEIGSPFFIFFLTTLILILTLTLTQTLT